MIPPAKTHSRAALLVMAAALILAACGGSDNGAPDDAEPLATYTETATATRTVAPTTDPADLLPLNAPTETPGGARSPEDMTATAIVGRATAAAVGTARVDTPLCANRPVTASPRVVYSATVGGSADLFITDLKGANTCQLTDMDADAVNPAWSPDGLRVAFSAYTGERTDLYVIDASGSGLRRLADGDMPSWSPDGTRLVYQSDDGTDAPDIYVVTVSGGSPQRITEDAAADYEPSWSPDGTLIVFVSERASEDGDLYRMNVDGSGVSRLAELPGNERRPTWSPDGLDVLFDAPDGEGPRELFAMRANGTTVRRLTVEPRTERAPVSLGDSLRIAFLSDRDGAAAVYVMNRDGTGVQRVTPLLDVSGFDVWP